MEFSQQSLLMDKTSSKYLIASKILWVRRWWGNALHTPSNLSENCIHLMSSER
jgi:hypothetical protein